MRGDRREHAVLTRSLRRLAIYGTMLGSILLAALFLIAWNGWEFGHSLFSHLCHQKSERCFIFGASHLAVCSRCIGIYFGMTGGCAIAWLQAKKVFTLNPWVGMILGISAIANLLDFGFEWFGFYQNAIWTRALLGLLLGMSLVLFVLLRSPYRMDRKEEKAASMRLPERG